MPDRDQLGLAAEARAADNPLADLKLAHALAYRLHLSGDLVAEHAGWLRCVRVKTDAGHRVGEVDPRGLDRDPDLPRTDRWVGTLLNLEHVVSTGPRQHHRLHGVEPTSR